MKIFYNKHKRKWFSDLSPSIAEYNDDYIDFLIEKIKDPKIRRKEFLKIEFDPTVGIPSSIIYVHIDAVKLLIKIKKSTTSNALYLSEKVKGCHSFAIIPFSSIKNLEILKKIEEQLEYSKEYVDTCFDVLTDLDDRLRMSNSEIYNAKEIYVKDLTDEAQLFYYLNN